MKPLSPARLVQLCFAGVALMVATLPWCWLFHFPPADHTKPYLWINTRHVILLCAPGILGVLLTGISRRILDRGLRQNRWAEPQIEVARSLVSSPVVDLLRGVGFVIYLGFGFLQVTRSAYLNYHLLGIDFFPLVWATLFALRASLKPVVETPSIPWKSFAPLKSSNWGT